MHSFDRLSLIAHLGSLLVGGLCGRNQDLLWITDEDEIAANVDKHNHAGWTIWYYLNKYAPNIGGKLVFVTTEADLGSLRLEDAVSIADLMAGGLAEALSFIRKNSKVGFENIAIPVNPDFSKKTNIILKWLAKRHCPMSKLGVIIEPDIEKEIQIKLLCPCVLWDNDNKNGLFID